MAHAPKLTMTDLDPRVTPNVPLHHLPLPAELFPKASVSSVAKHIAMPIAIGAGVAAAAAGYMALRRSRQRRAFSGFGASKSTLLATVTRAAVFAGTRALLRRALVHTSARDFALIR